MRREKKKMCGRRPAKFQLLMSSEPLAIDEDILKMINMLSMMCVNNVLMHYIVADTL